MTDYSGSESGIDSSADYSDHAAIYDLACQINSQVAAFCCGGIVPVTEDERNIYAAVTTKVHPTSSRPVTIRWDLDSDEYSGKVTFPSSEGNNNGEVQLERLLKSCAPASFGMGKKEVIDETYRKAVKLDTKQFSTNFNPYDCGIIDAISQTLLPGIPDNGKHIEKGLGDHLGIVAELYKLNIYSGPSGRFKSHVDTPQSENHFGSLVVCLPFLHKGGDLRIQHRGVEHIWKWSENDNNTIGWAAFYSDCEHEVIEVESGHRVTLTYNLYIRERQGSLLRENQVAETKTYPLYQTVQRMLTNPGFLSRGGTLGIHCAHAYAHSNDNIRNRLPFALKGIDMVIWLVFHELNLNIAIKPKLNELDEDDVRGYRDSDEKVPDVIGTGLHCVKCTERGGDDCDNDVLEFIGETWYSEERDDIHWLNGHGPQEIALIHMTYGNEPGLKLQYSYAAFIIDVPKYSDRIAWYTVPQQQKAQGEDEGEDEEQFHDETQITEAYSSQGLGDERSQDEEDDQMNDESEGQLQVQSQLKRQSSGSRSPNRSEQSGAENDGGDNEEIDRGRPRKRFCIG